MVRTRSSSDKLRNMKAIQVIEEILSKVFKCHRFPVSLKAEAVILYFKGLSLRAVRDFLLHKGYKVSIETIREWFHFVHLSRRRDAWTAKLVLYNTKAKGCTTDKGRLRWNGYMRLSGRGMW